MATRAKFKCTSISKSEGWGENKIIYGARLSVVMGSNEENKQFFAATPTGQIEIGTVREDHFEVGKEYYVDFTPAD